MDPILDALRTSRDHKARLTRLVAGIGEPEQPEPERERDERGRYLPTRKTPSFDGGARPPIELPKTG